MRSAAARAPIASVAIWTCLGLVALGGCASVPQVSLSTGHASSAEAAQMVGPRGHLSAGQVEAKTAQLTTSPADDVLLSRHIAIEQGVAEGPLTIGQTTHLLRDGPTTFRATFAVISSARRLIDMEYFIFQDVESDGVHLGDLLVAKRAEGVAVNVIYDSVGSSSTPAAFLDRLRQAGVNLVEYNPVNPLKAKTRYSVNQRDHRKILVVDGALAIMGGVNLDTGYEVSAAGQSHDIAGKPTPRMRDTDIRIEGPAAAQLQALFLDHWRAQHGPPLEALVPTVVGASKGPDVVRIIGSSPSHAVPAYYVTLLSQIRSAQKSVTICAAFFVPTADEMKALTAAARRGVDVRLLLPGQSDSPLSIAVGHSHYGDLLAAGVKIYETHDLVLHSKTVTIDGVWSVIGSSNFDHRSVIFNDEVDAVVLGGQAAQDLEAMFADDQAAAQPIDASTWRRRPIRAKLDEIYARVWQDWL